MKVIKIDIKKEVIDAPPSAKFLRYRTVTPLNTQILISDQSQLGSFEQKHDKYTIMRLKFPDWPEVKNFAVKVDEENLFHDLLNVRTGFIRQEVEKELTKELEVELAFTKDRVIKGIKRLPWYKRLFNQF